MPTHIVHLRRRVGNKPTMRAERPVAVPIAGADGDPARRRPESSDRSAPGLGDRQDRAHSQTGLHGLAGEEVQAAGAFR